MPEEGVQLSPKSEILTFDEIELLAKHFVSMGVNKIRLTGGEPLVRKDVGDIMRRLGAIQGVESLAITTNGLLFERYLEDIQAAGIDTINISIDTLSESRFNSITRRRGLQKVLRAIDLALEADFAAVKINCVVMRGVNDDEIGAFCEMSRDRKLDVRFIEFMPFGGNAWSDDRFVPFSEMIESVKERYEDLQSIGSGPESTARNFKIPGYVGTIGFITSMSDHFCAGCNRLRLTADGNLKVCLFGKAEVSLRDALRAGAPPEEISAIIEAAVKRKKFSHDGMYEIAKSDNRPMILIGG